VPSLDTDAVLHLCADTDSILCIFAVDDAKRYDLAEHFRVAQDVADKITQTFKQPIELEFEKCYWPYLLFSKKRYAGKMYTQPDHHDYIDVKGIQLVRRDNSPLVKTVSNAILDAIMHERSVEKAVKCARDLILDVLRGSRSIDEFVISKALRTGYKNPDSLPHVVVARKIQERTGAPPVSGERVNYVFIRDAKNPDGLIAMRAEDPVHVATNHMEIDTLYYVENQLLSPITTLLEVLGVDVDAAIMRDPAILPILVILRSTKKDDIQVAKRTRLNKKNNQNEITSFFKKAM
jgi:DNA polymerase delta subunit 1